MKIPKATKLPSGSWNVKVMIEGQRISITAPTKKEAEQKAAALKSGAKIEKKSSAITVDSAFDRYIKSKDAVLSPATVAGYRRIQKNLISEIANDNIMVLTQEKVQRWVNSLLKQGKKPKTIQNAHGLLSAVMAEFRPEFTLRTTLPQKVKQEILIPTESEAKKIFEGAKGTRYELPIAFAACLGLRASEIRGLKWSDIEGEYINIRRAIVEGDNGPVEKGTKTYSSTRKLHLSPYLRSLLDQQKKDSLYIVPLAGHAMYSGFSRICERVNVPHFRFHDLRHLNASIMLAEGIPDKYSMERMGHSTNNMLKTTYQHTLKERAQSYDERIESAFEMLLPH